MLHAIAALQILEDSLPRPGSESGSGPAPPALIILEKFSPLLIAQQTPYSLQSLAAALRAPSSTGIQSIEKALFTHIKCVAESKVAFVIWIQADGTATSSQGISTHAKQDQNSIVNLIKKKMHRFFEL